VPDVTGRVVSRGPAGSPVVMGLVELAVDCRLAFQVLTVQPFDELVSRLPAPVVRMMAITEHELAVGRGILPDPPASRLVAVVLLDRLVDACGDPAEDAELLEVRAEPGPEPVVGARFVDGACVQLEPVADLPRVVQLDGCSRHRGAGQADDDNRTPLQHLSPPEIGMLPPARRTQAALGRTGCRVCPILRSSVPMTICETP
jgi:hypothetical protein